MSKALRIVFIAALLLGLLIPAISCTERIIYVTPTPAPTPTPTTIHITPVHTPPPKVVPTPTVTLGPAFTLSPLTISPMEALSGQQVQISSNVSNSGGSGTYRAELEVDGAVVDAEDVWVPRGETKTITFSVSRDEPGVYNVVLGDRRGSFTVANPPLHIALDYVGVNYDHNPSGPGQIFLILLADDGIQQIKTSIPLEGAPPMSISDNRVVPVGESYRGVFDTQSVGTYFNIAVLAYHRIQQGPSYGEIIGKVADALFGLGGLGQITGSIIDELNSQAPEYEYVGSYQGRWNSSNSWGKGQYSDVGDDDLRLWLRIWSDTPQQPVPLPTPTPTPIIVPLDRYYNSSIHSHFYCTDPARENLSGYVLERIECNVASTQISGTVPLYRYYNGSIKDHFYCTDPARENLSGWVFEWIECYVASTQISGTIPLYRYYNGSTQDHFYCTNPARENLSGYVLERIECYVWP